MFTPTFVQQAIDAYNTANYAEALTTVVTLGLFSDREVTRTEEQVKFAQFLEKKPVQNGRGNKNICDRLIEFFEDNNMSKEDARKFIIQEREVRLVPDLRKVLDQYDKLKNFPKRKEAIKEAGRELYEAYIEYQKELNDQKGYCEYLTHSIERSGPGGCLSDKKQRLREAQKNIKQLESALEEMSEANPILILAAAEYLQSE